MIPAVARIWHEALGRIWMPDMGIEAIEALCYEELKWEMPLTYIALADDIPVGSCTLELTGGVRPDLGPWLGDLVVDPSYQRRGIGKMLIDVAIKHMKQLGFEKLYLFTFDPILLKYYERFGWREIGKDQFKSLPVTLMERTL